MCKRNVRSWKNEPVSWTMMTCSAHVNPCTHAQRIRIPYLKILLCPFYFIYVRIPPPFMLDLFRFLSDFLSIFCADWTVSPLFYVAFNKYCFDSKSITSSIKHTYLYGTSPQSRELVFAMSFLSMFAFQSTNSMWTSLFWCRCWANRCFFSGRNGLRHTIWYHSFISSLRDINAHFNSTKCEYFEPKKKMW